MSLGAEETEIRSDGTRVIVNPAHFSLGRVSVLHALEPGGASTPKTSTPFLDDFIVTPDPWVNGTANVAPFDQPFYLIMNVAVGGTNGWFPDGVGNKPWLDGSSSMSISVMA